MEKEESTIDNPGKSVVKQDCVPTQEFGATSSGQFKYYRLCLEKAQNMHLAKFASKTLATVRKANFQGWLGSLRSSRRQKTDAIPGMAAVSSIKIVAAGQKACT